VFTIIIIIILLKETDLHDLKNIIPLFLCGQMSRSYSDHQINTNSITTIHNFSEVRMPYVQVTFPTYRVQTELSSTVVDSRQWCPSVMTSNVKCNTTYTAESGLPGHHTMYVYRHTQTQHYFIALVYKPSWQHNRLSWPKITSCTLISKFLRTMAT
jgi:hypothetical protein